MLELLQRVAQSVGPWLYLIAGALAFGEAAIMIGVVVPGESALLVAGFAAQQGIIGLVPMIIVAVLAAIAGDTVGYEVGRVLGPRLRSTWVGRRIGEDRWTAGETFLTRHGGKAVLLGRSVALMRALTPGLAGMARMPYLRTFLPWNVAGGVLWGSVCVLLGYLFAYALDVVARYLLWGPIALIAAAVIGLLAHRWLRRRRATT